MRANAHFSKGTIAFTPNVLGLTFLDINFVIVFYLGPLDAASMLERKVGFKEASKIIEASKIAGFSATNRMADAPT